jgi:hypothetical protein
MRPSVELIFAEFNRPPLEAERFLKWFPEAIVRVISSSAVQFDGPRAGWRLNDYWKARGLAQSTADVAIAFDRDMEICSTDVRTLPLLARRFGLCLPMNPRWLVRKDTEVGADSDHILDESGGTGFALNCTPIAYNPQHSGARKVVRRCWQLLEEKPVRGPLAWWRACWAEGFYPCLLPPQWCVCQEHVGIGNEIILHTGHARVRQYYAKTARN